MPQDHNGWVHSCKKDNQIEWKVIDLFSDDWLQLIQNEIFDVLVLRPPGRSSFYKQIYDNRVQLLSLLYPENFIQMLTWLEFTKIKGTSEIGFSYINFSSENLDFLFKQSAQQFLNENSTYPLVSKLNIGAAGKEFLSQDRTQALQTVSQLFGKGKQ